MPFVMTIRVWALSTVTVNAVANLLALELIIDCRNIDTRRPKPLSKHVSAISLPPRLRVRLGLLLCRATAGQALVQEPFVFGREDIAEVPDGFFSNLTLVTSCAYSPCQQEPRAGAVWACPFCSEHR